MLRLGFCKNKGEPYSPLILWSDVIIGLIILVKLQGLVLDSLSRKQRNWKKYHTHHKIRKSLLLQDGPYSKWLRIIKYLSALMLLTHKIIFRKDLSAPNYIFSCWSYHHHHHHYVDHVNHEKPISIICNFSKVFGSVVHSMVSEHTSGMISCN